MLPRFVLCAVFVSGFASLGYELCWIRKGALLIGATPQALSIVVAVFFGGMAGGAYLFGLLSKRTDNPLFWYGMLECVIGVLAALTPAQFVSAGDAYAAAYQWVGSSQPLHLLLRSALVAALILPSSVLMGGTLPLLCHFLIYIRRADIRFAAGTLYAVNTLGAFFGCIVGGVYLIPFRGIDASIWFSSALSIAAGSSVILLSRNPHGAPDTGNPPLETPAVRFPRSVAGQQPPRFVMYGLFFCTGFASLGYEILWARFLSLIIHNTVYTSVFSLGAILLGIAIGGWFVSIQKGRPAHDAMLFAAANIFIALSVLLMFLQPVTAWGWIRESRSVPMQALLCTLIILVPSIASGITFPLAYRLVSDEPVNSGRDFGFLTAVNTVGAIGGSLVVGFFFLPAAGMHTTLIVLTGISLITGVLVMLFFTERVAFRRNFQLACCGAAAWLGLVSFSSTTLPADFLATKNAMVECVEGISSFITVARRDGVETLEIDRMWQGQNQKGHQILAAHIPMVLHQDPKRVLVVGLGTGQTASRFLMYDIDRLDCVDIEKSLTGMLRRHFDSTWLDDPRTHVVTDDGRNFVSHAREQYDIVSIEVGQSFRPQVASFYTVDFYRDVKKRLTKNGLACQFVPVAFFTENEFRSVVGSFLEVFPQSTLWFNKYAECIVIGTATTQPLLSQRRLQLIQNDRILRSDLQYSLNDRPWLLMNKQEVFAANFLMGPRTLAALSGRAPLYTDDRPILECQAARTIYSVSRFHDLIEKNLDSPDTVFAEKIRIATEAAIIRIREETLHDMLSGT
ncbi:MAG: fused MFS/spermidine synthase [Desulfuromonadaceae bacterium]|nr:fused MFS/spermidine synthase [Desulfuromonadaceae bacterium]